MASVGGPFQSGHGPVERAGVVNFVGRARANLAGKPGSTGDPPVPRGNLLSGTEGRRELIGRPFPIRSALPSAGPVARQHGQVARATHANSEPDYG